MKAFVLFLVKRCEHISMQKERGVEKERPSRRKRSSFVECGLEKTVWGRPSQQREK